MNRFPIVLAVVLAAFAGAGVPSPVLKASSSAAHPATRKEARRTFEAEWGKAFAGKTAAFAAAEADGEWLCAMPMAGGSRLCFLRVTRAQGAFVRGTLHYFGLEPIPLKADEYADLRRESPMLAVRLASSPAEKSDALLFAPTARKLVKPIPPEMRTELAIRPFDALFGDFPDVLSGRLRVKTDALAFRVAHLDAQGTRLELGTLRNVRGEKELGDRKVLDLVGAAFPKLVSDRARTDWFVIGTLVFEPVCP